MFSGFAQVWTPVERSARLRRQPLSFVLAGERIVLFRDAQGRAAALLDRCPHRGVALSLGKIDREGHIECPFHGWRFSGDGSCRQVPLNPQARCEKLAATALAVREVGGLLWVYTAPGQSAPVEPVLDESLTSDDFVRTLFTTTWRAHWTRAMENMLDMPHLPFVHRTTIGIELRQRLRPDSEMRVLWTPHENGGQIRAQLDGVPDEGIVEFLRPNRMMLHIPVPGRRLRLHVACVPMGPNETRMILLSARDFLRWLPLGPLLNWFNRRVALQDQAIVESSLPAVVPAAAQERSVASDKPTLQFRKYYFESLHQSAAPPASRLLAIGKSPAPASASDAEVELG